MGGEPWSHLLGAHRHQIWEPPMWLWPCPHPPRCIWRSQGDRGRLKWVELKEKVNNYAKFTVFLENQALTYDLDEQHSLVLAGRIVDTDRVVALILPLSTLNDEAAQVLPGLHPDAAFRVADYLVKVGHQVGVQKTQGSLLVHSLQMCLKSWTLEGDWKNVVLFCIVSSHLTWTNQIRHKIASFRIVRWKKNQFILLTFSNCRELKDRDYQIEFNLIGSLETKKKTAWNVGFFASTLTRYSLFKHLTEVRLYLIAFGPDNSWRWLPCDLHIQTKFISCHHNDGVLRDHVSSRVQVDLWRIWKKVQHKSKTEWMSAKDFWGRIKF